MKKSHLSPQSQVTAVIIAKNESQLIANCIETLRWCHEVIVIDSGSTDETAVIAENAGARVISFRSEDFSKIREAGLKFIKTPWLAYIDADERVTPPLSQEILVHVETDDCDVMTVNRKNICYGQELSHGGWESDQVTRVFKKSSLQGWFGEIHESPTFNGQEVLLHTPLIHLTHRSTQDNLRKSADWTIKEARLLAESGIPPVTFTTLVRKGSAEFFRRAVLKKGYKDGMVGLIESLVQAINRIVVYIQVWELQQQPTPAESYQSIETDINELWKQQK